MPMGCGRDSEIGSIRFLITSHVWAVAAVFLGTVLVYLPSLRNGWVWDDDRYVTNNIHLQTLHGLRELWLRPGAVPQYYPLAHTTFWIEYHLWGLHPLGYHLDNVLLHAAGAVLLGLLLCRLGTPGCWLAAALFALHPVQVESVAWVTERKNVLSGLFFFCSLWMALDAWKIGSEKGGRYLACLAFFVLAILSKSVTASLPAVILILIWWKRSRITLREVLLTIPLFVLGAAMGSVTAWMERHVVGAAGVNWDFTPIQRLLIAGRAIWFYLAKILWPHPLVFIYHQWPVDVRSPMQWWFVVAAIGVLLALVALRKEIGRGPAAAALYFGVSLAPALGFVNVYPMRYSFVADHFQYLACIGPLVLVAAGLARFRPATIPLLLILGVLSSRQQFVYYNAETLWRDVVNKDPVSAIGHNNLALILHDHGDDAGAIIEFERALAANSAWVESWIGLGVIAEGEGKFQDAMDFYQRAQEADPTSPLPPFQLGLLDRRVNRLDWAIDQLALAAQGLPNPAVAYEQMGEIELSRGDLTAAEKRFKEALAYDPDRTDAHNNLAAIYLADNSPGAMAKALDETQAALVIDPDNLTAVNNMGVILGRQGDSDAAAGWFHRAERIDPTFEPARQNLAKLGRQ
jgi:protein O-mannosyl-transferase